MQHSIFADLLKSEISQVLEQLLGFSNTVVLNENIVLPEKPSLFYTSSINNKVIGISIEQPVGNILSNLLIGESFDDSNSECDLNDIIDASKEILSCILGSVTTSFGLFEEFNYLSLKDAINDISQVDSQNFSKVIHKNDFSDIYSFEVSLHENSQTISFSINVFLNTLFSSSLLASSKKKTSNKEISNKKTSYEEQSAESNFTNNIINNIEVDVYIRIGTISFTLYELSKIDVGSVIDLKTDHYSPIELFAGDLLIAKGEIVSVDGNFGFQITELVSN